MAIEGGAGSDSDSSKVVTNENGHVRSNSVKKPASFKAVSVTKNFLKSATAAEQKAAGDKILAASQNGTNLAATAALRPRLVAKVGLTARETSPLSGGPGAGAGRGSGTDGKDVWGKNKASLGGGNKLTDEELQQTYGIHLASRLQTDESKDPKWADIDDDDEDWAPETIEWNDGTKVTLAATDEPLSSALDSSAPIPFATSLGNEYAARGGSGAAPLKFGGLAGRGDKEKPVLVAKPSQPHQVKSPWAPLPPVENPVPATSNSAAQAQFRRLDQREGGSSSHGPAQEIAADDFNRRGHGQQGTTRELFNSQSGQYEPVNGTRRGAPPRNDASYRQTAVLQRPSGDARNSAESSAAFQTHRSGLQDSLVSRRRTSSNVSSGSGQHGRRPSFSRAADNLPPSPSEQRRGSHIDPSSQGSSPAIASRQPTIPLNVPAQNMLPAEPLEDPVKMQERIMKESRELAARRKKEQAEQEEAERKKRIEEKLKSLPPAVDPKKASIPAETATLKTSPQKGFSETAGVRQYGLMRVHPAESVKRGVSLGQQQTNRGNVKNGPSSQAAVTIKEFTSTSNVSDPIESDKHSADVSDKTPLNNALPDERMETAYKPGPIGGEKYASRGSKSAQHNAVGSQWGSQTLGNGSFERGFGKYPPRQGNQGYVNGLSGELNTPGDDTLVGPKTAVESSERPKQAWLGDVRFGPGSGTTKQEPIGPPSQNGALPREGISEGAARWQHFAQNVQRDDGEAARQRNLLYLEERRLGISQPQHQVLVTESYHDGAGNKVKRSYKPYDQSEETSSPAELKQQTEPLRGAPAGFGTMPIGNHLTHNRSSRFFPHVTEPAVQTFPTSSLDLLFDPPPTDQDHPAFGSESLQPRVRLPALLEEAPKVVVRLPPAAAALNSRQLSTTASSERRVVSERSNPSDWQARIDSLMGKSASSYSFTQDIRALDSRPGDISISSVSKSNLDFAAQQQPGGSHIPISIPRSPDSAAWQRAGDPVLDATTEEEEGLFDDQAMGSLPGVNIPQLHTPRSWIKGPGLPGDDRSTLPWKTTTSVGLFTPPELYRDVNKDGLRITIRLDGMTIPKQSWASGRAAPNSYQPKKPAPVKKGRTPSLQSVPTKTTSSRPSTSSGEKQTSRSSGTWPRRAEVPAAQPSPL